MTTLEAVSACPNGHALPIRPLRWFDGTAWHDGREKCRHCFTERLAVERATRITAEAIR